MSISAFWGRVSVGAKCWSVSLGLVAIAMLDHLFGQALPVSHLYYVPILLAAITFGSVGGLVSAAAAIILFHVTHVLLSGTPEPLDEADLLRFALFLVVGLVSARLAEQHRRISALAQEVAARNVELTAANEELSRLSQARADFVAIASHELRNPVAVVLAGADTLSRLIALSALSHSTEPARLIRLADQVRSAARRLTQTVDNLLDITSVESDHLSLRQEEVRLADLLADCREAFVGVSQQRLVVAEVPEGPSVVGDRDKLARALANLVSNALKYSPESCAVTLQVGYSSDTVLISVSDRGRGISEEELPHVFERYYRTESGKQVASGTGLGLGISREIVRAHGGDIQVRSVPGRGSTFTVSLPRRLETGVSARNQALLEDAEPAPATHRNGARS